MTPKLRNFVTSPVFICRCVFPCYMAKWHVIYGEGEKTYDVTVEAAALQIPPDQSGTFVLHEVADSPPRQNGDRIVLAIPARRLFSIRKTE